MHIEDKESLYVIQLLDLFMHLKRTGIGNRACSHRLNTTLTSYLILASRPQCSLATAAAIQHSSNESTVMEA